MRLAVVQGRLCELEVEKTENEYEGHYQGDKISLRLIMLMPSKVTKLYENDVLYILIGKLYTL